MARKMKNMENEKRTMYDLKNGKKTPKDMEKENANCRTWKMSRILKIVEY
jgi:hypothetical protein